MSIGPVKNHRKREKGILVYPVYSRRSGGLSVGINLFPDRKVCAFDCPYCEVFPFSADSAFSLPRMEADLVEALGDTKERDIPVRDICFSGNGEPTQSADFPAALEAAFRIRGSECPDAEIVLISNGTGLLNDGMFDLLCRAARGEMTVAAYEAHHLEAASRVSSRGLRIWLKLDAGTPAWYRAMNRSDIPFEPLIEKIRAFVKRAPLSLQTMICRVEGKAPPAEEARAWEELVAELALNAAEIREAQIYGKARPAPEDPLAEALPPAFLEARAASLRNVLASAGKEIPVKVYP